MTITLVRDFNLSEIEMTIAAVLAATVLISQCDDNKPAANAAECRQLSAEEAAAIAEEAREGVDAFLEAWNTGSNEELAKLVRFPFVTLGIDGTATIDETPEDFQPGLFERIRERQQWDHSTFDEIEPVWVAENKVHFRVQWSRYDVDGRRYLTGDILYVALKVDDEWRIQLRSALSPNRRLE